MGLDLNTTSAETFLEYRKTTDTMDLFTTGYGRVGWGDLSYWGDEDYQAGVKFGVSW